MNKFSSWRAVAGAFVMVQVLAGCGGGGGSPAPAPPTGGETPAPAPPSPSPAPTPPAPSPSAGPTQGRLWHDDYALDTVTGTQIASAAGVPVTVTASTDGVPWPDGTQFATREADVVAATTQIQVVSTQSGATLYAVTVDGFVQTLLKPSPTRKDVVMATIGASTAGPADNVIIDMATATALARFAADGPANWLPDGRYIRMTTSGALVAAEAGGTEQTVGQVQVPTGHTVSELWVNRQGDKIAYSLLDTASSPEGTDLWLSAIDGSGLVQFTNTAITSYARWSPDGQYIAFDADTGSVCGATSCVGVCQLWVAPVTSRDVATANAAAFTVKDDRGANATLGCDLLGWSD